MAPRPPLQEDRREGQDEGGEAGWQAWHGGVSRRGWASLTVPPAAPPSSPRRPLSRPPNPPPNGQSRAQEGGRFFRPGDRVSRFAFVAAERANHAVATLCRVVGASVSACCAWRRAILSVRTRAETEAELRGLIGRIFAARRRAYGSRRVHAELRREGRRH